MEEISKEIREKSTVEKVDGLAKQLSKNWAAVKNAGSAWDFRSFDKALAVYSGRVEELTQSWSIYRQDLVQEMEQNGRYVESEEYRQELEQALLAAGIPLQGSFPQYEFVPFKLTVAVEEKEIRLAIGRKQEKTVAMQPKQVTKWVGVRYQKLIGKRFDGTGFMRELLGAYKVANRLAYREGNVLWGRAVALEELYELLTLKRGSRQEYPKPLFLFELGRLKEQFEMKLDEYQFEFGFPRKQEKAVTIVDSRGRESRVSSLTVHKVVE
ncbi:hypothetical protein [Sporomusa acidovorans]|uniref:Uncharacterized protein n=1 Tax=Sporomusa acidovorans (strain ATCC 49682 / DSM 3132 / Mol) TaxID=1123286 RepID=A0ABZ3J6V5_SPOA4|nr:hypothetical protein [Sporomusa acidovorans]OZC19378.1 hypothetical protein SPACI_29680 [Sporomusa acidovorans DSM 3132]SDD78708.1 hypothetical protein SAMN04488499_100448 [Sporomusa acidovorans]